MEISKNNLIRLLQSYKEKYGKIVSYGATSKSTTIFNYCGIDTNLIDYIVDTTPSKQGKFSPGVHIPVMSYSDNFDENIKVAFLGAWNYLDEIVEKEYSYLKNGGIFITHVPDIRTVQNE